MPPRPRINLLRLLRLQLKTGFLRNEPPEYQYLRRYPPFASDTLPKEHRIRTVDVPHAAYYQKVVERNPLYLDERVYGAYSDQEPQALVLAKKQYQYVKQGLDDEAAYQKALKYIDELEDKAYIEFKKVNKLVEESGGNSSFLSDTAIVEEVNKWKGKLSETPYEELPTLEQGELDYFIQKKILKWSEIERERRMKDPIFVMQFDKLLHSLFPANDNLKETLSKKFQTKFKENFLLLHEFDPNALKALRPFYVEDYLELYEKARQQPDLSQWEEGSRDLISSWIIETLAYRDIIENRSPRKIQSYLDSLRDTFFPMLRYPNRKDKLPTLTIDQIKSVLYANEIGYKKEESKLFVKRFYRLPKLLFPLDTFCVSIANDEELLDETLSSEEALVQSMTTFGLDAALVDDVKGLIGQIRPPAAKFELPESVEVTQTVAGSLEEGVEGEGEVDDSAWEVDSDVDEVEKMYAGDKLTPESPEWGQFVRKHLKVPETALEKERHSFYNQMEYNAFDKFEDEIDVTNFKQARLETETAVRARLSVRYEAKEAARRSADWEKRGVWLSNLPPPSAPLIDSTENST